MLKKTKQMEEILTKIKEHGLSGKPEKVKEAFVSSNFPMLYRHFKGNYYMALGISYDCDTGEPVVKYKAFKDEKEWLRPLSSFASYVDNVKYPEVDQHFRLTTPMELYELGYTFNDLLLDLENAEIDDKKHRQALEIRLFIDYQTYKEKKENE